MKKQVYFLLLTIAMLWSATTNAQIQGNALAFDGSCYVQGGDLTLGNFGTADFSIEAWINTSSNNPSQIITSNRYEASEGNFFLLGLNSGYLNFEICEYGGMPNRYLTGTDATVYLADGLWHHVAMVRQGVTVSLYVDGSEALNLNSVEIPNVTRNLGTHLGARNIEGTFGGFFIGQMDDVRFWNKALTLCEINTYMSTELNGMEPSLEAYYTFNQGAAGMQNPSVTTLTDKTMSNHFGDLVNFTLDGVFSNWVYSNANILEFNGDQIISTDNFMNLTSNSVDMLGMISYAGTLNATERGFCYAPAPCPTIANMKTNELGDFGMGGFMLTLGILTPNTTYFVRAYAISPNGVSYGNETSFTTASGGGGPVPGLVAQYLFNGDSFDMSGNNNHAVAVNNPISVLDRFNNPNSAMGIEQSDDYLYVEPSVSLNLTQDKSFSFWINPSSNIAYSTFIGKTANDTYWPTYAVQIDNLNDNKFTFMFGSGAMNYKVATTQSINDYLNQWMHIAATYSYSSGDMKIFFNGTLSGSTNVGSIISELAPDSLFIGKYRTTNEPIENYNGLIDDICIYNRAISESEVDSLYHVGDWGGVVGNIAGNTLQFDGIDDLVNMPSTAQLGIQNNSFSVEAWINGTDYAVDRPILARSDFFDNSLQLMIRNGKPFFGFYYDDLAGNTILNTNQWYHLAFTFDTTTKIRSIYVNGILDAQDTTTLNYIYDTPLALGFAINSMSYFVGKMDELRIWNHARNACDIKMFMNMKLNAYENGLTAYYDFDQGTPGGMNTSENILNDGTSNFWNGNLSNFDLTSATGSNWFLSDALIDVPHGNQIIGTNSAEFISPDVHVIMGIVNMNGNEATEIGVCYSPNPCPTIFDPRVQRTGVYYEGEENFTITDLEFGMTYYLRAYSISSTGVSYGNELIVMTSGGTMSPPGNALSFDGIDDYVHLPNNAILSFRSQITLETWINTTGGLENYILTDYSNSIFFAIGGGGSDSGKVSIYLYGTNPGSWYYGNTLVNDGGWHHIAISYDGTSLKMFVDGNLDADIPVTGLISTNATTFEIGSRQGVSSYFNGQLDELRMWNIARNPSDIKDSRTIPLTGTEPSLVAYYNFDQGNAGISNFGLDSLLDLTMNNNVGTLNNFNLDGDTSNWVESYAMAVPTNVSAVNIQSTSFDAKFSAPLFGTIATYTLEVDDNPDFSSLVLNETNILVPAPFNVSALTPFGTYYFRVKAINSNGIAGGYSDVITVNLTSSIVCNAGPDTIICINEYQMQATDPSPFNGMWMPIMGMGQFSDMGNPNTLVTGLGSGINRFVWNVNGVNDTVTIYNSLPVDIGGASPIFVNLTMDTICMGQTTEIFIFNSQPDIEYQLKLDGSNYLSPQVGNGSTLTYTLDALTNSGIFTILAKDPMGNGCFLILDTTLQIVVNHIPMVNLGLDLNICKGATMELMTESEVSDFYIWSNFATSPSISVSIIADTTFSVTVSNMCGTADDTININVASASNADYTITPITANTFSFTNLAASTTNLWNFGDGTFSNEVDPQHTYSVAGIYNVCLSVADIVSGCNSSKCQLVDAGSLPASCYATYTYTEGAMNEINFNSTSSLGNLTNFYWQFGDGTYSFTANPIKTYTYAGLYNARLTVYDTIGGCMNSYEELITVGDASQDCEADYAYYTQSPNTWVYFTVTTGLGNNYTYTWNFGDGNTSTDMNAIHTYAERGYYDVCLTVLNNSNGCSNITCKNVLIGDSVIFCYGNFTYLVDSIGAKANSYPVSYKGAAFGDPAKDWSTHWDFGDGGTAINQMNPEYSYGSSGYYLTMFRINNGSNSCINTFYDLVNINSLDGLQGGFGYEVDSNNTKANSYPVTYKGAAFGDPARLSWTFGDGTGDSTTINPTHIYSNPGTYSVCLTVSDPNINQSHTSCRDVDVIDYTRTSEMEKTNTSMELSVSPNPGKGHYKINIKIASLQEVELSVYDVYGKLVGNVLHQQMQKGTYDVYYNLSSEKQGVFYLRMVNGKEIKVVKFINL